MAAASSRAHLINQLNRRARSSSPREDDYATATSFDAARDAIHSTQQFDNTSQQPLPQHQYQHPFHYNQYADDVSEGGSEGSAEMSIELGRGVKRDARERDQDISSNMVFDMGDNSLYEVTATPPSRSRNTSHKTDDGLRRQASVRRATETAKGNEAMRRASIANPRSLSAALKQAGAEDEASFMAHEEVQHTTTFNARNTRFARSRQTSTNEPALPTRTVSGPAQHTPRKAGGNNATAQSNSFMLPDLPNIAELVSGVRKDGTPVFNRNTQARSRFASDPYKMTRRGHNHIESVPIPEEEKAIYASLQLLKDRVDQLEMEKSEAQKRTEEYESEIIDLRSQLAVAQRRPDSALGSDEEVPGQGKWKTDKVKLQSSVKALQDRFDRSERKISVSEIAVKRVTKERDELITQIGVAYYNNEELKAEVEAFKQSQVQVQTENQELRDEVDALRKENQDLRLLMAQTQRSYDQDTLQREQLEKTAQNAKELRAVSHGRSQAKDLSQTWQGATVQSTNEAGTVRRPGRTERPKSTGALDGIAGDDLATRIAQEVRKNRDASSAKPQASVHERMARQQPPTRSRSRSKSATRQAYGLDRKASASKRTVSAPVETEVSDADSTTQLDFTQKSNTISKKATLPAAARPRTAQPREEDNRDLTLLSWQDPNEVLKLRKQLEADLRAGKLKSNYRAPAEKETTQGSLPRKSSLKDLTNAFDDGTGRFSMAGGNVDDFAKVAKSVRVRSPHTSDGSINPRQQSEVGDTSVLSNMSRRRQRAVSADGLTSAFILPDITLHACGKTGIAHDNGNCTACPPGDKDVNIPKPVPVTDRGDIDVTNATIRPSQAPPVALATVIKQLQDEISHLKLQLAAQQRLYNQHNPALSKRRRVDVKIQMDRLTAEVEKRSDQVYALFDVLEGQKGAAGPAKQMDEQEVEETLSSLGIDPIELSGRVGRKEFGAPFGLDGADELSQELAWEGLSEAGSGEF